MLGLGCLEQGEWGGGGVHDLAQGTGPCTGSCTGSCTGWMGGGFVGWEGTGLIAGGSEHCFGVCEDWVGGVALSTGNE